MTVQGLHIKRALVASARVFRMIIIQLRNSAVRHLEYISASRWHNKDNLDMMAILGDD